MDSRADLELGIEPAAVSTAPYDEVVIGAGAAGIIVVQCLKHVYILSAVVLEGQLIAGGRVRTCGCGVDLSASHTHGVI